MSEPRVYRPTKTTSAKKSAARISAFRRILGQDMRSDEMTVRVRTGFPITVLERLRKALDVPQARVLKVTHISAATYSRRRGGVIVKKGQAETPRLKPEESDRVYRITSIMEAAEQLFEGDHEAALRWLKEPAKALGGVAPLDYLDTEVGSDAVRDLIGRLEHGVVT